MQTHMREPDPTTRSFLVVLFDLGSTLIYFDSKWSEILPIANRQMVETLLELGYRLDSERFCTDFERSMQIYYVERETEFIEYTTNLSCIIYWKNTVTTTRRLSIPAWH